MTFFSHGTTRRDFIGALALGALGAGRAHASADALGISEKLVQLIVPFTPGTTPDLTARLYSQRLAETAGQAFVVENRPGASGIIGLSAVAKAAPDGHTLAFSTNTALTLPFVYNSVPFDVIESFTPVAMIGYTNFVLCVHPSLNVSTLQQLAEYARRNPAKVNYGSPGKGTFHHLCMEMLAASMGLNLVHVPYKGSAGATTDLLAGHIKAMFQPMHVAMPLAQEKRITILGSTRKEQDVQFPDIKPLASQGATGFDADAWYSVIGPKGMAPDTVAKYNAEINRLSSTDAIKATLAKQGVNIKPISPAELLALSKAEHTKWQQVIKTAGITPE